MRDVARQNCTLIGHFRMSCVILISAHQRAASTSMPRLGKRAQHLRSAREAAKKARVSTVINSGADDTTDSAAGPSREPHEVIESSDDDFDVEEALKGDSEAMIEVYS